MVGVLDCEFGKLFEISVLFTAISTPVKLRGVIVESPILCYVAVKTL